MTLQPRTITQSKQLLVEGIIPASFFEAFLSHYNLTGFQIQNFGGNDELRGFIGALKRIFGFNQNVTSLAVVRDAEIDPNAAFQSVCASLANESLPVPTAPGNLVQGPPKVGVYILPDPTSRGMIESLCLRAVRDDPVMPCVNEYFNCLNRIGNIKINIDKAMLQTFLASKQRPVLSLKDAGISGYLNFGSIEYESLRAFLGSF
jgi:hypothetical protein